jgi:hypothetical protein
MNDQDYQQPQEKEEQQPSPPPGRPYYHDEKTEEKYEKEDEKHQEKHNQDPLSSLAWALILIWAGLVFLASNLGWLDRIQVQTILPEGFEFLGLGTWSVIALGAGIILFVEAIIRMVVPAYRSSTGGSFFLAAIFIGIGLSGIFGWQLVWPLVLIGLGLTALASALIRGRK